MHPERFAGGIRARPRVKVDVPWRPGLQAGEIDTLRHVDVAAHWLIFPVKGGRPDRLPPHQLSDTLARWQDRIRPGDVVHTPTGEWHWHGAAPDHFMTRLSLRGQRADAVGVR
jgi:hypothetical protein